MMRTLKACCSLFRIKMAEGLQYRAAALSGLMVGSIWVIIDCAVFTVFFKYGSENQNTNGMNLSTAISYLWITQALLPIRFNSIDDEILSKIKNGDVGIELCRPLDLYYHWLFKSSAGRLGFGWIRSLLTLTVGLLMPFGYRLSAPASVECFFIFILSVFFTFAMCSTFGMMVTAIRLNVTWGDGPVNLIFIFTSSILSGAFFPLRLWPEQMQSFLRYQPFSGFIDTPAEIYTGLMAPNDAFHAIMLQIVWMIIFFVIGRFIMKQRLKSIIVQGG